MELSCSGISALKCVDLALEDGGGAILRWCHHKEKDIRERWTQSLVNLGPAISILFKDLQREPLVVVVPTDETNGFRTVPAKKYVEWMVCHLEGVATPISKPQLGELYDGCMRWVENLEGIFVQRNGDSS